MSSARNDDDVQCPIFFEHLLQGALLHADDPESDLTDISDDEDSADETSASMSDTSPLTSLENSPTSSPLAYAAPLPKILTTPLEPSNKAAASLPSNNVPPTLATSSTPSKRKLRKRAYSKRAGHKKRKLDRADNKEPKSQFEYVPPSNSEKKFVDETDDVHVDIDSSDFKAASTGFIGAPADGLQRKVQLDELIEKRGFKLVPWKGRSYGLVDRNKRRFGAVVAPPKDSPTSKTPTWEENSQHCADKLEESRPKLQLHKSDKKHRRGKFPALPRGISHGQGQDKPGVLKQNPTNKVILDDIFEDPAFVRVAGHQSSAFATFAPELFNYYANTTKDLLNNDPDLKMNFPNSVFACTSINFGPQTICYRHNDYCNLPFGWCAITAFGHFNHKLGGHFIMWDCKLVIELPPGGTVIIPSACVAHSNTPIQRGEKRYSMTQYTAGSIFRWVEHGFQQDDKFWARLKKDDKVDEELEKQAGRLAFGLSLYRTA